MGEWSMVNTLRKSHSLIDLFTYSLFLKISGQQNKHMFRYPLIDFFHFCLFASSHKKDEVKQQNENDIQRDGFFHKDG